jgi:hypothetical protein
MATYTTLQFLTALQAGTRESPITIFDGDGEFLGYLAEDTPVPKAAASGTITFSDVVYDGETVTIGSVDGGDGSVAVEADTEGSAGNSIATTTDALNGAWGAATLEGGADGSTGTKGEVRYDSSYMYICVENTTDGSGWKKLSLSSL